MIAERRKRVASLWNDGWLSKDIASDLGIHLTTVRQDLEVLSHLGMVRLGYRRYPRGVDRETMQSILSRLASGADDAALMSEFGLSESAARSCRRVLDRTFL